MSLNNSQNQFMVRLPEGLRDKIKETAAENYRSMNAEIVFRLAKVYLPETEKGEAGA